MKRIAFILLIALFAVGCSGNSQEQKAEEPAKSIAPENIQVVEFDVEGMTCTGCEKTIEAGVNSLDGISEVQADHKAAKTTVKFDKTRVNPEDISSMIREKGYEVAGFKQKE